MRIGIVEDECVWQHKIYNIINRCVHKKSINCEIIIISDIEDVLKENIDLLFLDIELEHGQNGLDIAEKMLMHHFQGKICFLTSHTEFAREGYKVNAFRYIDKIHLDEIEEAINSYLETKIQEQIIICENVEGLKEKLRLKDIVFIETCARKLKFFMMDGREYICNGLISEYANALVSYGFYQVQRSYIINMKYVKNQNSRGITLLNGMFITIGRKQREEFKKVFFDWRMKYDI